MINFTIFIIFIILTVGFGFGFYIRDVLQPRIILHHQQDDEIKAYGISYEDKRYTEAVKQQQNKLKSRKTKPELTIIK